MADVTDVELAEINTVMRHLEVDFRVPLEPGETVTVAVRPVAVGETSFTLDYALSVDGREVATGRTVSVRLDEDGRPAPLPGAWQAGLGVEDGD